MNSGVIDNFLGVFTQYIDSRLRPAWAGGRFPRADAGLHIILAALFWRWAGDEDIIACLVKKTLFVGVFAYPISKWQILSRAA